MKKISVVIPTYNEEANVEKICLHTIGILEEQLSAYDYEIVFIDNDSQDSTRQIVTDLCRKNEKVKAIFNAKNFGYLKSPYYGIMQATGDCVILMAADFQEPPEMIPKFVKKWEEGYKVVCATKTASKESALMYALRSVYYKTIRAMSTVEQIEHYTGFGLYDADFVEVLRNLGDPMPYMRGIVAELGIRRCEVEFTQPKRDGGRSSSNFFGLYNVAMLGFTSYTKIFLRLPAFLGGMLCGCSTIAALVYFILWCITGFAVGSGPIIMLICFLFGVQLFFTGMMGEYILNINERVKNRPLVVEERRLNFKTEETAQPEKEAVSV